jgi:hypothetical protein
VITEMTMTMHVFEHAPVGPRRCNARGFTGLLSLALTVALAAPVHAAPAKSATSAKSAGPAKSTTGASGRPSRAAAGPADTADATEEDVGIDVTIGTGIPRAQALRTLVRDDVSRVLRALDVELGGPERVRLAIELGGTPPDFRVQLGVSRSGSQVTPVPEAFVCTCTHEELRTRINQAAVKLVPTLKGEPAVTATDDPVPPPVVAPPAANQGEPPRRRVPLGVRGKAGIGGLVGGGALAIAGGVLVGLGTRSTGGELAGDGEETNFRPAGYGLLAGGVAVLIAGAALLGVDRARARRLGPRAQARQFSFSVRF